MNLSSTPRAGKRKAKRHGRQGTFIRSGQVLAVAQTAEGWRAVVCTQATDAQDEPVVADLYTIDSLDRRQQSQVRAWIEKHESKPATPPDLVKLRDRYAARANAADARKSREARLVLSLIERAARAEQRAT
jgi:hypothetical protein